MPSEQLWLGIAASVSAGAEGGAETDSLIGGARVKGGWGGGWAGEEQEQNRPATTAKDRATDTKWTSVSQKQRRKRKKRGRKGRGTRGEGRNPVVPRLATGVVSSWWPGRLPSFPWRLPGRGW